MFCFVFTSVEGNTTSSEGGYLYPMSVRLFAPSWLIKPVLKRPETQTVKGGNDLQLFELLISLMFVYNPAGIELTAWRRLENSDQLWMRNIVGTTGKEMISTKVLT